MRVILTLLLLLINITIFSAEFQIDAEERQALIKECTKLYGHLYIKTTPSGEEPSRNEGLVEEICDDNNIDLVLAARKGNTVLCKQLLKKGVKADAIGGAALMEAIKRVDVICVELLLNAMTTELLNSMILGGSVSSNPFAVKAIMVDSMEILKQLRNKGVFLHGGCALGAAVFNENCEIAKLLLERHANPNGRGLFSLPVLHQAARTGNNEMIKLLIEYGADVNDIDYDGHRTPLHEAAQAGHHSSMELLQKLGAQEHIEDRKGETAEELYEQFCSYVRGRNIKSARK